MTPFYHTKGRHSIRRNDMTPIMRARTSATVSPSAPSSCVTTRRQEKHGGVRRSFQEVMDLTTALIRTARNGPEGTRRFCITVPAPKKKHGVSPEASALQTDDLAVSFISVASLSVTPSVPRFSITPA